MNFIRLVCVLVIVQTSALGIERNALNTGVLSSYWVTPQSDALMKKIADKFEVVRRHGKAFEVIIPAARAGELLILAPDSKLIEYDLSSPLKRAIQRDATWLDGYHSFAEVEKTLRQAAERYPMIARLETYGNSQQGRPLFALKVSDYVELDEEEPEIMLTASTHGDELITTEVVLELLDKLLKGYEIDERLTDIVDNTEIYFIPVVNPDGFIIKSRYANGVDPNRDYPWPEKPNRNPVSCIENIIAFFHSRDITGSIDYHASGRMIMYPWAYTYNSVDSSDERILSKLTQDMSSSNGYVTGQISKVIYVAKGSSADYYYWKNKSLAIGVEIGNSKIPHNSTIPQYVEENREMTWVYLEHFIN